MQEEVFGYVVIGVAVVGFVVAVLSLGMARRTYDEIGKGGLFEDDAPKRGASGSGGGPAGPPASESAAEREDDIRSLLQARSDRRESRGQAPIDVEAELQELLRPAAGQTGDPEVVAEVRELVESRNRRRLKKGQAPLDVDAEVARRLAELKSSGL